MNHNPPITGNIDLNPDIGLPLCVARARSDAIDRCSASGSDNHGRCPTFETVAWVPSRKAPEKGAVVMDLNLVVLCGRFASPGELRVF